jgi:peptidoglycan L-alanyl-D-glutamate endopeptidase CwlK
MTSRNKNYLHPILRFAVDNAIAQYVAQNISDPVPFITCTYRDFADQDILFKQKPKVTNAKAGESPHNYNPCLAFDLGFKVGNVLNWNITYFKKFADLIIKIEPRIEWGGSWKSFKDNPHYQLIDWKSYIKK